MRDLQVHGERISWILEEAFDSAVAASEAHAQNPLLEISPFGGWRKDSPAPGSFLLGLSLQSCFRQSLYGKRLTNGAHVAHFTRQSFPSLGAHLLHDLFSHALLIRRQLPLRVLNVMKETYL